MPKTIDPNAETIGIMIRQHRTHGIDMLDVCVMIRRATANHPCNPSNWTYDEKALALDGLMIHGYLSECYVEFYKDVCFRGIGQIDLRMARRMAKTLDRIDSFIAKADAREPGDVLMSFAKAIGATWIAMPQGKESASFYSDNIWRYEPLTRARDLYRNKIAEMLAAHPLAKKEQEAV